MWGQPEHRQQAEALLSATKNIRVLHEDKSQCEVPSPVLVASTVDKTRYCLVDLAEMRRKHSEELALLERQHHRVAGQCGAEKQKTAELRREMAARQQEHDRRGTQHAEMELEVRAQVEENNRLQMQLKLLQEEVKKEVETRKRPREGNEGNSRSAVEQPALKKVKAEKGTLLKLSALDRGQQHICQRFVAQHPARYSLLI